MKNFICFLLLFLAVPIEAQVGGLTIPENHPRLWFDSKRFANARKWFAAHSFTPNDNDFVGWSFHHLMTGKASDCTTQREGPAFGQPPHTKNSPISWVLANARNLVADPQQDQPRYSGEAMMLIFDWCYDALGDEKAPLVSALEAFVERYRPSPLALMGNYTWGYFRNQLEWGITSYNDNPQQAANWIRGAINGTHDLRADVMWDNFVAEYRRGKLVGGVPYEGTSYGEYQNWYSYMPLTSAELLGRDMFSETGWFKERVIQQIYWMPPAKTYLRGAKLNWWLFPFGDGDDGDPALATNAWSNFMLTAAGKWASIRIGKYARQWYNTVHGEADPWVQAVDGHSDTLPFSTLPLDYYAAGPAYFYGHEDWSGRRTAFEWRMGDTTGYSQHTHDDFGNIAIWRKGRWLNRASVGYSFANLGYRGVWGTIAGVEVQGKSATLTMRPGYSSADFIPGQVMSVGAPDYSRFRGSFMVVAASANAVQVNEREGNAAAIQPGDLLVKGVQKYNYILVNGDGFANQNLRHGQQVVRRMESRPAYSYIDVDLTNLYLNNDRYNPQLGNLAIGQPAAASSNFGHVEREAIYLRQWETTVVFDRLAAVDIRYSGGTKPASAISKTFLAGFEYDPTIEDANHITAVNNDQALRVTVLVPASPATRVINNHQSDGNTLYRLEVDNTAAGEGYGSSGQSYSLIVMQALDATAPNLNASVVESNPGDSTSGAFTATLTHPTLGTATLVFNKGTTSSGGTITVNGNTHNLRNDVQVMTVTDDGPVWH